MITFNLAIRDLNDVEKIAIEYYELLLLKDSPKLDPKILVEYSK